MYMQVQYTYTYLFKSLSIATDFSFHTLAPYTVATRQKPSITTQFCLSFAALFYRPSVQVSLARRVCCSSVENFT